MEQGNEVTEFAYEGVLVHVVEWISARVGPASGRVWRRCQNVLSSLLRHVRKNMQSIFIQEMRMEDLEELEVDTRACILLLQQERRRRTVEEFSAARDALFNPKSDGEYVKVPRGGGMDDVDEGGSEISEEEDEDGMFVKAVRGTASAAKALG